jgi:hypothetical protein
MSALNELNSAPVEDRQSVCMPAMRVARGGWARRRPYADAESRLALDEIRERAEVNEQLAQIIRLRLERALAG